MALSKLGKRIIRQYYQRHPAFNRLQSAVDDAKILAATRLIKSMRSEGAFDDLREAEFKVFSQFGDDGIIQYLIHQADVSEKTFVEFGSSDYLEANTRFLVVHDDWRGLLIDGSPANIDYIKRDSIYWQHDLTAVAAFITKDNINDLIRNNGFTGNVGILSIDLDGNDYWIWDVISVIDPTIVITEYNAVFGNDHAVSVPYDAQFYRFDAHYSGLFWGASLRAFCFLAEKKGYAFVGCNSGANNAYFVRRDRLGSLKEQSPETGFRAASWSDSRDTSGRLNWLRGQDKAEAIKDLTVIEVTSGQKVNIGELGISL